MIKKIGLYSFVLMTIVMVNQSCYYDNAEDLYPGFNCDTVAVSFGETIQPLIIGNCATANCHSGPNAVAGLKLETYAEISAAALTGSMLDRMDRSNGDPLIMPPTGRLGNCQIDQFDAWVRQGALNN